jgi:SAM-dependent MidA family methyltransferase
VIVEQGRVLRDKQQRHLAEHGFAERVRWFATLDEVMTEFGPQAGVILSNELFDALPVHRLGRAVDGYVEYYVVRGADGLCEEAGPLSDPALLELLDEKTRDMLPVGERLVVCPAAGDVIEQMGALLTQGFVLTIDYGNVAPDVHLHHRQHDGVRAYYKQKLVQPFERVGEQDLTADVDFTLLMRRGERAGLQTVGLTTQMNLLGGNGFLRKVEELRSKRFDLVADAELFRMLNLFMPSGLGDVFKVLVQSKGLDAAALRERVSALKFSLDNEE